MKLFALAASLFAASQLMASAQLLSDPNLLTTATATSNSNYSGLTPANSHDGTGNEFVFADYLRGTGPSSTTIDDQILTFSNLVTPTGINSLRFYDAEQFEVERVAKQVTIYYSTSPLTGNSLNPANYTALNGGVAFQLPVGAGSGGHFYSGGVATTGDNGSFGYFDTLTNLNIPVGTTSLLFDFGAELTHTASPNYNVGVGFAEIQAFGGVPAPEPGTWAMMLGALLLLGATLWTKVRPVTARA